MVSFGVIKNGIGFGLKAFGFFWGIFDRVLCDWICFGGSCSNNRIATCSFIFLFVAIIFVVCGYAIVRLPKKEKEKVKDVVETELK